MLFCSHLWLAACTYSVVLKVLWYYLVQTCYGIITVKSLDLQHSAGVSGDGEWW